MHNDFSWNRFDPQIKGTGHHAVLKYSVPFQRTRQLGARRSLLRIKASGRKIGGSFMQNHRV
jgi:hypothetical protein